MSDEEIINELIALLWPLLDDGVSRDEIECHVTNVLDSWEPTE